MQRDELLERVRKALSLSQGLRAAFVFGSQLSSRARRDSDLDIAVRYRPGLTPREREDLRRHMSALLEKELGALGERSDLVDLDESSSTVAFHAIRDGVCVFEASPGERTAAAARVFQRYNDDEPRRALFRASARRAFEGTPRG